MIRWLVSIVTCMMLFLWISPVFGQDSTRQKGSRIELSLEGMAGVSFGDKMVAFNVGGPNLLLALGSDWRIGFAAFPSFFVRDSKTGARLGVGGRVDYKKLVLFTSFYHFDTREIWVGTVGLGYKFHKSSQKK